MKIDKPFLILTLSNPATGYRRFAGMKGEIITMFSQSYILVYLYTRTKMRFCK